jgi:PTH2 family peptidyl-tRNA hydrolase
VSYTIKQVIVFRADLKVRKGKFAAQVAHASMKVFLDRGEGVIERDADALWPGSWPTWLKVPISEAEAEWLSTSFAKIVLLCPDLDTLDAIAQAAAEAKLPCALVVDSGRTEFHGVPTPTCLAIGPAKSEDIDKITGPDGPFDCRLA